MSDSTFSRVRLAAMCLTAASSASLLGTFSAAHALPNTEQTRLPYDLPRFGGSSVAAPMRVVGKEIQVTPATLTDSALPFVITATARSSAGSYGLGECASAASCNSYGPLIWYRRAVEKCESVQQVRGSSSEGRSTAEAHVQHSSAQRTASQARAVWVTKPELSADVVPELYWLTNTTRLHVRSSLYEHLRSSPDPSRSWPALHAAPANLVQAGLAEFSRAAWDAARQLIGADNVHSLDSRILPHAAVAHIQGSPSGTRANVTGSHALSSRRDSHDRGAHSPGTDDECQDGDWRIVWSEWRLPAGRLMFIVRHLPPADQPAPPAATPDWATGTGEGAITHAGEVAANVTLTDDGEVNVTATATGENTTAGSTGSDSEQDGLDQPPAVVDVGHWWPAEFTQYRIKGPYSPQGFVVASTVLEKVSYNSFDTVFARLGSAVSSAVRAAFGGGFGWLAESGRAWVHHGFFGSPVWSNTDGLTTGYDMWRKHYEPHADDVGLIKRVPSLSSWVWSLDNSVGREPPVEGVVVLVRELWKRWVAVPVADLLGNAGEGVIEQPYLQHSSASGSSSAATAAAAAGQVPAAQFWRYHATPLPGQQELHVDGSTESLATLFRRTLGVAWPMHIVMTLSLGVVFAAAFYTFVSEQLLWARRHQAALEARRAKAAAAEGR